MDTELMSKILELEYYISSLPNGTIVKKTVKGHIYYYHRYSVEGKRYEDFIPLDELEIIKGQVELRKKLEQSLKVLIEEENILKRKRISFYTNVLIKDDLRKIIESVKEYKTRKCFKDIEKYLYNDNTEKVLILYGLRRTGKTTLMRQAISKMSEGDFNKTALIHITSKATLELLHKDIRKLSQLGYKYIFIDEVTLLEDFIEGASVFSDIFASSGMKIILTGTDSLGFMMTKHGQLYDRCILLHTTYILYSEFENVLGIKGIDEYIKFGGTMSLSGINYNNGFVFNNNIASNEYIDSSIANNIQHSLKYYQDGSHFRNLKELYDNNELTNVINRVVEDINHRFTKEILTKKFKSNDLSLSKRNIRSDENISTNVLEEIDLETFTNRIKIMLEILDINEQKICIKESHASEIKEYLELLDLIYEINVKAIPYNESIEKRVIISQPGLRFSQAKSLIKALMLDQKFQNISIDEKNLIIERILSEIKGRMLEDIVILETLLAKKEKEVFILHFTIGEFDMVVQDVENLTCEIYEIKYNNQIIKEQYKHLIDMEKCKLTEHTFGKITKKAVIYRGITTRVDDIDYINVEEYLINL